MKGVPFRGRFPISACGKQYSSNNRGKCGLRRKRVMSEAISSITNYLVVLISFFFLTYRLIQDTVSTILSMASGSSEHENSLAEMCYFAKPKIELLQKGCKFSFVEQNSVSDSRMKSHE